MKSRYINTKFWLDPFIGRCDPIEKMLFLYFLTNEHTNIVGIYELDMRVMEFETGLSQDDIKTILIKFEDKILYYEGYVIIKNFHRHQSKNSKISIGMSNILKRELPTKVIKKLIEIGYPLAQLSERGDQERESLKERFRERKNNGAEFSRALD